MSFPSLYLSFRLFPKEVLPFDFIVAFLYHSAFYLSLENYPYFSTGAWIHFIWLSPFLICFWLNLEVVIFVIPLMLRAVDWDEEESKMLLYLRAIVRWRRNEESDIFRDYHLEQINQLEFLIDFALIKLLTLHQLIYHLQTQISKNFHKKWMERVNKFGMIFLLIALI